MSYLDIHDQYMYDSEISGAFRHVQIKKDRQPELVLTDGTIFVIHVHRTTLSDFVDPLPVARVLSKPDALASQEKIEGHADTQSTLGGWDNQDQQIVFCFRAQGAASHSLESFHASCMR